FRLSICNLSDQCCEILASTLQSPDSSLRELDLSNNDLQGSRVELVDCKLTDQCCKTVGSVLQSSNSLRELDLSNNELLDSGVELLSAGLKTPNCQLNILSSKYTYGITCRESNCSAKSDRRGFWRMLDQGTTTGELYWEKKSARIPVLGVMAQQA
uniref:NAL12 n=1 Tax=Cyprinus carpio TaxID=7962 RepID=A0A8C2L448_CYPCA